LTASPTPTLPQHIAIIMDGNRRWAKKRFMPAALGHAAGAKRVRKIVELCAQKGVSHLSLFAFSTENWKRPEEEVLGLMGLFMTYLQKEVDRLELLNLRHHSKIQSSKCVVKSEVKDEECFHCPFPNHQNYIL
jgi:undecaprenyl diphosphate synthase